MGAPPSSRLSTPPASETIRLVAAQSHSKHGPCSTRASAAPRAISKCAHASPIPRLPLAAFVRRRRASTPVPRENSSTGAWRSKRIREGGDGRDLNGFIAAERTGAPSGVVSLTEGRRVSHRDGQLAAASKSDKGGPERNSLGVHPGAIDGVYHPDTSVASFPQTALLTKDTVVGVGGSDLLANRSFGRRIDFCHGRRICLQLDRNSNTESVQSYPCSDVREVKGEVEVVSPNVVLHSLGSVVDLDGLMAHPIRDDGRRARIATFAILMATVAQLLVATFSSGLEQFEGKAFGARLIAYPLMMLLVPAVWAVRRRMIGSTATLPWLGFALIMAPFLIDVTGNTLNLYDSVNWWDDLNHFVNWLLLSAGIGVLLTRSRISPPWALGWLIAGLGALLAIGWELGEWYAFIRNGTELDTAYQDTLGDEFLGSMGAALAGLILTLKVRSRPRPEGILL